MAMEVDGAAILSAIAHQPAAFAMSTTQVNTLAMQTLLSRLKDKAADLSTMRQIAKTIGTHDFAIALDTLPQKDIASIFKRLDPKHPDLKTADETALRAHVAKLAAGALEPTAAIPAQPKTPKAPAKPKSPKMGQVMKSKALKARSPAKKPSTAP
jgi:hypothetical protein